MLALKQAVAFLYRRSGETELSEGEFVRHASLDLHWFSPKDARRFLEASRALGYHQVLAHLAGACSQEQARADTIQATRRFVRRQRSWFRRDDRITWLDGGLADAGQDFTSLALRAIVEG